jgi:hypothetical protein
MTATTDTLRRDSFTADAMNDLLDFVVRDRRFPELGIRGAIVIVLGRHLGVPPSEELVSLMARAFWDTWDDRLGELAGDTDDD